MIRSLFHNPLTAAGMGLAVFLISGAVFAPLLSPHDPLNIDLSCRLKPPSKNYLLGTDNLGRCVFSRILYGARISLAASLSASTIALLLGMLAGLAAGLGGRPTDMVFMRMADMVLAFPGLIFVLVITGIMGPSLKSMLLGLVLTAWAWWARFVRGLLLAAKEREFVHGAFALGVRGFRLVFRYILPQIAPQILVVFSMSIGSMIAAVSGLSYLGLGAQPPEPEWGMMLKEARIYLMAAPWLMLAPGTAVTLSVLAFHLFGEGLRDLLQVKETTGW